MKILHVHNMMIRNKGIMKFYSGRKFSNGIIRNNHTLLEFSDRDLNRYLSPIGLRSVGRKKLQRQLIDTCFNFQPDLIILGHCELISNESLLEIRRLLPNVKIAHWFLDPLWIKDNTAKLHRRKEVCDTLFVTTGKEALTEYKTSNNKVSFIPNPVDHSEEPYNNGKRTTCSIDLLFCGARNTDYRSKLIAYLKESIDETHFTFKIHGLNYEAPIWGEAYKTTLSETKMALNLNGEEGWPLYSSDRIAQLMGNGILTFLWDKGSMKDLIRDEHAVFFDSKEDLLEKILYYHTHDLERQRIAIAGYHYYHTHFSAESIIKYMIETTFQLSLSEDYVWQGKPHAE